MSRDFHQYCTKLLTNHQYSRGGWGGGGGGGGMGGRWEYGVYKMGHKRGSRNVWNRMERLIIELGGFQRVQAEIRRIKT